MTPTVLFSGPYRFFFFSSDRHEPPHVHVEREAKQAKFWLDPIRLEHAGGFGHREIARIEALIRQYRDELLRAWHEFFSD